MSIEHSLLVDVKTFMYRFGYSVPLNTPDFCQEVADAINAQFSAFRRVVFANDGAIEEKHPKFETTQKRAETRRRNKRKNEQVCVQPNLSDAAIAKLDRAERAARGVSLQQSQTIMQLLSVYPNFTCVQCDGEADDYIAQHHGEFDLVVSQDSDFIVAGVSRLVCNMGTSAQALFCMTHILETLQITQMQLQEIAAMAGNDYTLVGIRGMGLDTAYDLIRKYGTCKNMLANWTQAEHVRITVEPAFYALFNESMLTYNKQHAILLDVPEPQQQPTIEQKKNDDDDTFFDTFVDTRVSKKPHLGAE